MLKSICHGTIIPTLCTFSWAFQVQPREPFVRSGLRVFLRHSLLKISEELWTMVFMINATNSQFSSRSYICALESPYALQPVFQSFPSVAFETVLFPKCSLWNSFDWRWPLLILPRKIAELFLFLRLSHPNDGLWNVLGFVPASRVSRSSTFKIFRVASHYIGCFVRQPTCCVI